MLSTQSLRTIDQTKTGSLLSSTATTSSTIDAIVVSKIGIQRPNAVIHIVDNVLSVNECQDILKTSQDNFGFQSMQHSYHETNRQADRLCVLDEDLAALIWKRLEPIHAELEQTTPAPFGFYTSSDPKWQPIQINPCCRLSRYKSPSVGFTPHFDSPYTPDVVQRSGLSVVLYLSDVGETKFYDAPLDTALIDVAGLTVQEEISVRGGLEHYVKHTVKARHGRCLLFPHHVLHAGAPVSSGTKWLLRSDVLFENKSALRSGNDSVALGMFREAQNQELDGNIIASSNLYERTLSLRMHANDVLMDFNMWSVVLGFLNMNDLTMMSACSVKLKAWCERHRVMCALAWDKCHPTQRELIETIESIRKAELEHSYYQESNHHVKKLIEARVPDYLPRFQERRGCMCKFVYTRSVFDANPEACLRALTMAAIYQFGISKASKTYVAQYDQEHERALACTERELLDAAFYELPLSGAWYHVHASRDANLSCTGPDPDTSQLMPREALGMSVDNKMLWSADAPGLEQHLSERGRETYIGIRNNVLSDRMPGYTEIDVQVESLYVTRCQCDDNRDGPENPKPFNDTSYEPLYYNNLICDFSHTRLHVDEAGYAGPNECGCDTVTGYRCHWIARLQPLGIQPFQHAACQWTNHKIPGTERYQDRFLHHHHELSHLHLYQSDEGNNDHDTQWWLQPLQPFDPRPLRPGSFDSSLMHAPSHPEDEYQFVSYYGAVVAL